MQQTFLRAIQLLFLCISACDAFLHQFQARRNYYRGEKKCSMAVNDDLVDRLSGKNVLIVQNKGGGHGSLGYYLADTLLKHNQKLIEKSKPPLSLTIWQEKTNYQKSPFKETVELQSKYSDYFKIDNSIISPTAQPPASSFDYVIDNWSKSSQNITHILQSFSSTKLPKQYVFISSAGMYQQDYLYPITEDAKVKDSNDVRKTEIAILEKLKDTSLSNIKYTFLRPQYLYGPKSSKNYLSYFIGRVLRGHPIPLPLSGDQLVCLTHQQDAANFILAVVGNEKAFNQIYNTGTNRYISYKGIAELVYKALNTEKKKFLLYDPKDYEHWKSSNANALFPFRRDTFITSVGKALQDLNWRPEHSIETALPEVIQEYLNSEESKKTWGEDELQFDNEVSIIDMNDTSCY